MSKFASLTAGLLARKGEAEPTSTPFAEQLLTRVGSPASDIRALTPMHSHVHTHVEPGAYPKEEGLKLHTTAKPNDAYASVFGTFGRRAVLEAQRHQEAEAVVKPPAPPALTLVPPHEEEEHADNSCAACPGPSPEEAAKTFHVNLRLKRQRFVKLKLSAALLRRPVQEIVSEALDQWFEKLPPDVMGDCACLRGRAD
ncbi:MAG: hypothetical protein SGI91_24115 [Alphaproteobacteria bacterium]|nr:hypothetical protein [Alphaproteobacteria bacterium]